jgi:hypothetical protein
MFVFFQVPDVSDCLVATGIVREIFEVVAALTTERRIVVNRIVKKNRPLYD